MNARKPTTEEPVIVHRMWKNRKRNESIRVSLRDYEGRALIDVRVYQTGIDGIDRPTTRGIAMGIRKLPELAKALAKAEADAKAGGLLDEAVK